MSNNSEDKRGTLPLLLGISDDWVGKRPTPNRYPISLRPELKKLWVQVLDQVDRTQKPEDQWYVAIQQFISKCLDSGLDPFVDRSVGNGWIEGLLIATRHQVVRYIKATRLLALMQPVEQKTTVKITDLGFAIESRIRGTYEDGSTSLARLLGSRTFMLHRAVSDRGQLFTKTLWPNLWVYALILSNKRLEVGFRITINHAVSINSSERMTRTQIKDWIIRRLWLPVVRVSRIEGTTLRTRNF